MSGTDGDDSEDAATTGREQLLNLVGRICKQASLKSGTEILPSKPEGARGRVGRSRSARGNREKGKSALLQAFKKVDRDRSGKLNRTEVNNAIESLGYKLKPWEASLLLDSLDASGDGLVSYAEFADALVALAAEASIAATEKAAQMAESIGGAKATDFSSPEDAANQLLLTVVGRAAR